MSEKSKTTIVKAPDVKRENRVSQTQKPELSLTTNSPIDQILLLQEIVGNQTVQRMFKTDAIQRKLGISAPNDIYEQEADRVAEQVMRMPEPQVQRKTCSSPDCKEEDEDKILKAKSVDSARTAQFDHPLIKDVLSSPDQPLDTATRSFMEPRFGKDFSGVRVHTGSKAEESARAVNARAYTVGRDMVFGEGQYALGISEGRRLVAYELTHVLQQSKTNAPKAGYKAHELTHVVQQFSQPMSNARIIQRQKPKVSEESKIELLAKKTHCGQILDNFIHIVINKNSRWTNYARDIGSAYCTAYTTHKNAVKDVGRKRELVLSLAFGLLTAALGGAGGGLGEFLSDWHHTANFFEQHKALAGALEDGLQTAIGEGIDTIQLATTPIVNPIPLEPQEFQNEIENTVDILFTSFSEMLTMLQKEVLGLESDDELSLFKPVNLSQLREKINNWWESFSLNESPPPVSDKNIMKKAMERNIWASWMPCLKEVDTIGFITLGTGAVVGRPRGTVSYSTPGRAVERRFDACNITSEAGVTDYGIFSTSDSEIIKLLIWASKHAVERLGIPRRPGP